MRLRRIGIVGLALAAATAARAQLDVSLRLPMARALLYEPLPAQLTVRNLTDEALTLDETNAPAQLRLDIESQPGRLVARTAEPLPDTPWTLPARGTLQRTVNLTPLFELRRTGPYTVAAQIIVGDRSYGSRRLFLDIVPGFELGRLEARLSGGAGRRTYTLRSLHRDRHDRLFIYIEDEDAQINYGVLDLGTLVRLYDPMLLADGAGRAHVLHGSAPGRYTYSILTPDGRPAEQK